MSDPWAVIEIEEKAPRGEPPTIEDEDPWNESPEAQQSPAVEDQDSDEPPWEVHARVLRLPPLLFPPPRLLHRLPEQPARTPEGPEQKANPDQAPIPETGPTPTLPPIDDPPRVIHRTNPTAIRGWKSPEHLLEAIKIAGFPPPYELKEHVAGFLRYSGPTSLVNYYSTTQTALVQGKLAGTWDERLRAARTLTLHF